MLPSRDSSTEATMTPQQLAELLLGIARAQAAIIRSRR